MKRFTALALALLLGVTLFSGCAAKPEEPIVGGPTDSKDSAKDTSLDDIKAKGKFIVGLDDAFPPMGYSNKEGEIVGFDIDLAKAVAEEMGINVEFQPVVWDNIAMEINNKNVDVIWNGCTINDERKEVFDFSEPYMLNNQILVVAGSSPVQTEADLKGKKLGIQEGSSANVALDKNAEFKASLGEVVGYENNAMALLDLANGRLDAVLVDVCVFAYYTDPDMQADDEVKPGTDFRRLEKDLGAEEFGIAFNKDADSFREALQAALDNVIKSGKATEISKKWFGRDVIPAQ